MAEIKIAADSGGGTVALKGPATTNSNNPVNVTLPKADIDLTGGSDGQYLKTNGSGTLSWGTIADNSITGAKIALGSDASGDIMYYNGTDYVRLAKGTDGNVLTQASGVPSWAAAAGGGKLIAVSQGTYATNTTTTSESYVDTGIQVVHQCAHSSNKLILIATISNPRKNSSDHAYGEAEIRNDTAGTQVIRFSNGFAYTGGDPQTHDIGTLSIAYLYTPGNTTENTYKVRIRNIHSTGNVGWSMNSSTSTFLAIELDYS